MNPDVVCPVGWEPAADGNRSGWGSGNIVPRRSRVLTRDADGEHAAAGARCVLQRCSQHFTAGAVSHSRTFWRWMCLSREDAALRTARSGRTKNRPPRTESVLHTFFTQLSRILRLFEVLLSLSFFAESTLIEILLSFSSSTLKASGPKKEMGLCKNLRGCLPSRVVTAASKTNKITPINRVLLF